MYLVIRESLNRSTKPLVRVTTHDEPVRTSYLRATAFSVLAWPCPLKNRVGANSPSLWPTMFSVTNTGMNFFPLWTANVWPIMSGMTVDRRDHVLINLRSFVSFMLLDFLEKMTVNKRPLTYRSRHCELLIYVEQ